MWACEYEHFEIVKLLIENKADVNKSKVGYYLYVAKLFGRIPT